MGYYVETEGHHQKAEKIAAEHGGTVVSFVQAKEAMNDKTKAVIVTVNNGMFEAAGFAYDLKEFEAFTDFARPTNFVVIDRQKAKELTGFKGD